ncbi:MAG TPA: tetratricopeptide repeat protein [Streptosporangiaceae bacterium]|nr:tetratricopeptide repeat protein [Streptosporangiaceae bacterium]
MGGDDVADEASVPFADLLRRLRTEAGLTQEGLAAAARLSTRSVSDLERGVNLRARRETARLLAGALGLTGPARAEFEAAARGELVAGQHRGEVPAPADSVAAATRTLPRDVANFTGRRAELRQLADAIANGHAGGVVGICAIGGMAGIGKTAFAVHAAHLLASQFPDGQIYLPLHGHTPGQKPVEPAEALASLLLTAGVPASQIPPGLEARSRLWRDYLAGTRLLLVLDDAAGHEQVRPLLPGTAGSLVLLTSRRHLTALEDTHTINLDTLPALEAAELLIRLAGRPGLDPGDPAVGEITRLCGYLPLAIGMLAGQLRHHPAWTCGRLAADLAAARDRLAFMRAENLSVAAAFGLSYDDLTPGQQQMFRRLGLHPGNDIDGYAAAALNGVDLPLAQRRLEALYDQHLLTEPGHGRFRMHDLILEHARTLVADDPAAQSDLALGRLLDYYLHAALAASRRLPQKKSPGSTRTAAVTGPVLAPDLSTPDRASEWIAAERQNLQAAASYALLGDRRGDASLIVTAMHSYLRIDGHWDQAQSLYQVVIGAAREATDRVAEAGALTDLGEIQQLIGDYPQAAASLTRALELYRDLGDRLGEASALNELGIVQLMINDHPAAIANHTEALALYIELGIRAGEASALNELGLVQRANGDYREATVSHERALRLYTELGIRAGEASALNRLAQMQRSTGDYPRAAANHEKALRLHRQLGNLIGQATALYGLGIVYQATGDNERAAASQMQALELYRSLSYRYGEATALNGLGNVQAATGDYRAAISSYERALSLNNELGNRIGQATSLTGLAATARAVGDHASAAANSRLSLQLRLDTGHRPGEADALSELGALQLATGDYPAASASLAKALELYRELGIRSGEATALNTTGELLLATGQPERARPNFESALRIARAITLRAEQARAMAGIERCPAPSGEPAGGRSGAPAGGRAG